MQQITPSRTPSKGDSQSGSSLPDSWILDPGSWPRPCSIHRCVDGSHRDQSVFSSSSTEIIHHASPNLPTPSSGALLDWDSALVLRLGDCYYSQWLQSFRRAAGRSAFVPWTCSFLPKVKGGTSQHALRQKDTKCC